MSWFIANGCLWLAWASYWFAIAAFTARAKSSESWWLRLTHLLPAAVAFFLIFHDRHWGIVWGRLYESTAAEIAGTALTAAGLLLAVWARVHLGRFWSGNVTLKQGHELIRTGPYRLARHPIYTGFLAAALGSAITAGSGDAWLGFAILVASYLVKMHREEKWLSAEFGESYREFQSQVAMLVPFVY